MSIVVTNGTDKVIKGRYAGQDYTFPVGEPVAIPEIVAGHIFGFGFEDKSNALLRLGWMPVSDMYDAAMERLAQVKFGLEDEAKTSSNVGPLVNAGGAAGEGKPSPKATRLKQGAEQIV